jgi:hypothetical protein
MSLRKLSLIVAAGAALSVSAHGQTILEYGINAGRAGTAGAASGAGAAGILSTLKGTMSEADRASQPRQQPQTEAKETEKEQEKEKTQQAKAKTDEPKRPVSWDLGSNEPLRTSSGIVISGHGGTRRPAPSKAPKNSEPTPVSEPETLAAAPAEPVTPDILEEPQPAGTATETAASEARWGTHLKVRGVTEARTEGSAEENSESNESALAEIPAGTPVEKLIERFGKPVMTLKGIAGREYDEKYVFEAPDGKRLTVLALAGKVVSARWQPAPGSVRAAF